MYLLSRWDAMFVPACAGHWVIQCMRRMEPFPRPTGRESHTFVCDQRIPEPVVDAVFETLPFTGGCLYQQRHRHIFCCLRVDSTVAVSTLENPLMKNNDLQSRNVSVQAVIECWPPQVETKKALELVAQRCDSNWLDGLGVRCLPVVLQLVSLAHVCILSGDRTEVKGFILFSQLVYSTTSPDKGLGHRKYTLNASSLLYRPTIFSSGRKTLEFPFRIPFQAK